MSKELQKTNGTAPTAEYGGVRFDHKRLQEFTDRLHDQPLKENIQLNKQAGNAKYIPIGIIETKLDELFFGLWSIENFRWQVIANEVTGSLDLKVFHPSARVWITRTGAASVPIQQTSGADINDLGAKIKNALVKNFPALKAECVKNAAKSFGPIFGRDLNRVNWEEYTPFTDKMEVLQSEDVNNALEQISTQEELAVWMRDNKDLWQGNEPMIDKLFTLKKSLSRGIHTR